MEYITIIFYLLFLLFAIFITIYNLLYSYRITSAGQRLGIELPKLFKKILDVNTTLSLLFTIAIIFFLIATLLSVRFPSL